MFEKMMSTSSEFKCEWTGSVRCVTKAESFLIPPVKLHTIAWGGGGSFFTVEWQNDKISRKEKKYALVWF